MFLNPLKPSGNYVYAPSALRLINFVFCIYGFRMVLAVSGNYFLNDH
jgi:hypothetical protein